MSKITEHQNMITVMPEKDLVASFVTELSNELKPLISDQPKELVIDLEHVEMVDSLGMGVLIATHNTLADNDSMLKVINIKEDIYNAFVTMRLNHHFTIEKRHKGHKIESKE